LHGARGVRPFDNRILNGRCVRPKREFGIALTTERTRR
jgi:hypothetical protein